MVGEILRYDPVTDEMALAGALSPARHAASAIWDPRSTAECPSGCAYVFGGWNGGASLDEIVRFDPDGGTTSVVGALPSARHATGAAFDGALAYVVGGWDSPNGFSEIVAFDPLTGAVAHAASLPSPRYGPTAFHAGGTIDIVGGAGTGDRPLREIVRFDTVTGSVVVLPRLLPAGRTYASAVWTVTDGYAIGGKGAQFEDDILRVRSAPRAHVAPISDLPCIDGGAIAILDGRASSDPDGDALTWTWSAPGAALADPLAASTTARFPLGDSSVALTVFDGEDAATKQLSVSVVDEDAPEAQISLDPEVGADTWERASVRVSASGFDACLGSVPVALFVDGAAVDEGGTLVEAEGMHDVLAVTSDGVREATAAARVGIDRSPPGSDVSVTTVTIGSRRTQVAWSGEDALSGIASVRIERSAVPDGPWTTLCSSEAPSGSCEDKADVPGTCYRSWARDRAGNEGGPSPARCTLVAFVPLGDEA